MGKVSMVVLALILGFLLPPLLTAAFLLGRYLRRGQEDASDLSPVSRQHFEIFQSGSFNEAAVEAAKGRFLDLLERGDDAGVEASLRPGTGFVFQVRALAEIGTDAAGQILERQLRRRLSEDQVEQAWYWIDLASGLRTLNRQESLPHLFRCADVPMEPPLGHFFAAETVCFLGFMGYVREPETALGQSALRVLQRAMEGMRLGVQAQLVCESRLGEIVETLWDHRPDDVSPLLVRVLVEVLRLMRRIPHSRAQFADDPSELEAFEWQTARLVALEPALREYLLEVPLPLRRSLLHASGQNLADALQAIDDLGIDAGSELMALLRRGRREHADLVVDALRWSRDEEVGQQLRRFALRHVNPAQRSQRRRRPYPTRRAAIPGDLPYRSILRSLRGHPSAETERFLLLAAQDFDPAYRAQALGSLGWWEPFLRDEVRHSLETARRDPKQEVRQAARGALARLGERAALHWFRQALHSDNPQQVFEAVHVTASEGLTLLWPDIDRLADSENAEIAHHARESLERLSEELELPRPW